MPQVRTQKPDDMDVTKIPRWTLGDRLRKARRHAGLQALDLAEQIGVSANTISNAENDRGPVTRRTLVGWAWATGVPIQWLEHGTPEGSSPEEMSDKGRLNRRAGGGSLKRGGHSCWSSDVAGVLVHPNLLGGSNPSCRQAAQGRHLPALDTPCATATDLVTCRSQAG